MEQYIDRHIHAQRELLASTIGQHVVQYDVYPNTAVLASVRVNDGTITATPDTEHIAGDLMIEQHIESLWESYEATGDVLAALEALSIASLYEQRPQMIPANLVAHIVQDICTAAETAGDTYASLIMRTAESVDSVWQCIREEIRRRMFAQPPGEHPRSDKVIDHYLQMRYDDGINSYQAIAELLA